VADVEHFQFGELADVGEVETGTFSVEKDVVDLFVNFIIILYFFQICLLRTLFYYLAFPSLFD